MPSITQQIKAFRSNLAQFDEDVWSNLYLRLGEPFSLSNLWKSPLKEFWLMGIGQISLAFVTLLG